VKEWVTLWIIVQISSEFIWSLKATPMAAAKWPACQILDKIASQRCENGLDLVNRT
jgi:hypothetical protein